MDGKFFNIFFIREMDVSSVFFKCEPSSFKEAFWFPLAAGTIGGLAMSIVGIFVFLPLMTVRRENYKKR
ncbi:MULTISPECIES: hypothetical protein [Proteiniphilum]|jgi:hypothetical protein|uniref:hypothetical protein n=1 Tax=Proteiniphilum TaxID=294702 RepID=UPI001EEA7C0D|nr:MULTISPECIES: hypothetical protein [Proteiniphilum]ULB33918.1 hypothetical protein KDN43_13140 [Proteiniphilum propionicum]